MPFQEVDANRLPTLLHKKGGLSREKPVRSPFQGRFQKKAVKRIPAGLPSFQGTRQTPGQAVRHYRQNDSPPPRPRYNAPPPTVPAAVHIAREDSRRHGQSPDSSRAPRVRQGSDKQPLPAGLPLCMGPAKLCINISRQTWAFALPPKEDFRTFLRLFTVLSLSVNHVVYY